LPSFATNFVPKAPWLNISTFLSAGAGPRYWHIPIFFLKGFVSIFYSTIALFPAAGHELHRLLQMSALFLRAVSVIV
jgi:hypothetical protein